MNSSTLSQEECGEAYRAIRQQTNFGNELADNNLYIMETRSTGHFKTKRNKMSLTIEGKVENLFMLYFIKGNSFRNEDVILFDTRGIVEPKKIDNQSALSRIKNYKNIDDVFLSRSEMKNQCYPRWFFRAYERQYKRERVSLEKYVSYMRSKRKIGTSGADIRNWHLYFKNDDGRCVSTDNVEWRNQIFGLFDLIDFGDVQKPLIAQGIDPKDRFGGGVADIVLKTLGASAAANSRDVMAPQTIHFDQHLVRIVERGRDYCIALQFKPSYHIDKLVVAVTHLSNAKKARPEARRVWSVNLEKISRTSN